MPASKARRLRRQAVKQGNDDELASEMKQVELEAPGQAPKDEADETKAATPEIVRLEANDDIEIRGKGANCRLVWNPSDGRVAEKGTTLLRLDPLLIVPDEEAILTRCYVCFSKKGDFFKHKLPRPCSGCHLVRYCSSECQKSDVDDHAKECAALKKYNELKGGSAEQPVDPGEHARLTGRYIWNCSRRGIKWQQSFARIPALIGQLQFSDDYKETMQKTMDFLECAKTEPPKDLTVSLIFTKIHYASYKCATLDQNGSVGVIVDPIGSFINHSCVPNVTQSTPEGYKSQKPLHWVAITDLQPGDELVYAYTDISNPYALRQEDLLKNFLIKCRCELCLKTEESKCNCEDCINRLTKQAKEKEGNVQVGKEIEKNLVAWIDPREAVFCGRENCDGWLAKCPLTSNPIGFCTKCKDLCLFSGKEIQSAIDRGSFLLDSSLHGNRDDAESTIESATPIMKKLSTIQPPCAYPLFTILRRILPLTLRYLNPSANNENAVLSAHLQMTIIDGIYANEKMITNLNNNLPRGSIDRAMMLKACGNMLLSVRDFWEAFPNECQPIKNYLCRSASLPTSFKGIMNAGLLLLYHASEEFKIGLGKEIHGGIVGRETQQDLQMYAQKNRK